MGLRCPVQVGSSNQMSSLGQNLRTPQISDQVPEIRPHPHVSLRLCGDTFQPPPWQNLYHTEKFGQSHDQSQRTESSLSSSVMAIPYRNSPGAGIPNPSWKTQSEADPISLILVLDLLYVKVLTCPISFLQGNTELTRVLA